MREHRVGGLGADDADELFAGRAAHAGDAAEGASAAPSAAAGRCPAIASSSDRRSRFARDWRWNVTANRCASSRMRWISSSAGLSRGSAMASSRSRVNSSSSFFAMPTATSRPSPSSSSAA